MEKNKSGSLIDKFPPNPTTRAGRRLWFKHLDPVVREKAKAIYHDLQIKHRDRGTPTRILVATATHMAKRELGLLPSCKYILGTVASKRRKLIHGLRTKLGLNQSTPTLTEPCEVSQANLDGI